MPLRGTVASIGVGADMEFLLELVFWLLGETLFPLIAEIAMELGWESLAHPRGRRQSPVIAGIAALLLGAILGAVGAAVFPERLLAPPPFPGISLLLAPLVSGMAMQAIGDHQRARGRSTSFLASFVGGALFAFGMAAARLVLIPW